MVTEVTENITQKLEAAIKQSDETTTDNVEPQEEVADEIKETEEGGEEELVEEPEAVKWTEEQQAEIDKLVAAESDRKSNQENESYRRKLVTANERDKRKDEEITGLKKQLRGQTSNKKFKTLIDGIEEEGYSDEVVKSFTERLKEHSQLIERYEDNYDRVENVATFASVIAEKLNPDLAKDYDLSHSDPVARAEGALRLIAKTEEVLDRTEKRERVFLKAINKLIPKGGEVRQKLEGIIEELGGFGGNEKSEDIFLESQKNGFMVRPRKAPPSPSQYGGGEDLSKLSMEDRIERHLIKANKNK